MSQSHIRRERAVEMPGAGEGSEVGTDLEQIRDYFLLRRQYSLPPRVQTRSSGV